MSGEIAVFSVIGIGLVGAVMAVLLRQYRPEFAMLVTLAVAVGIFALSPSLAAAGFGAGAVAA